VSPTQAAALGELVMRWRESGEDAIAVQGADAGPSRDTALAAVELLKAYGAQARADLQPAGAAAAPAPVRVSFARLEAVIPDCASRWGELTRTKENQPHAAFGCAVTANMAAQMANPGDLARPRGETPADGDRRADVMDKYRKGQPTATQRSPDERGVVSNAVQ
jgi:pilus assembly protein CpaD